MGRSRFAFVRTPVAMAWLCAAGLEAHVACAQQPALRSPQVRVNGGALQGYLNSVGENINVQTDQRDVQLLRPRASNNSTFTVQFEFAGAPGNTLGIYDGHSIPGTLIPVFPAAASNYWFAIASWRSAPIRVVVTLFDSNASLVGQATFLGSDRNAIGLYLATPHATYFTQDALNPAHEPRALFYEGTGINSGSIWLTWEAGDAPANDDFNDGVIFIENFDSGITPVQRATWSELKSRFR